MKCIYKLKCLSKFLFIVFSLFFVHQSTAQDYDLAISKTIFTPGPFAPGDLIVFQIVVENEGTLPAANVVVTENSPTDLIFVSSSLDANVTDNLNETFTIWNLAASATQLIEVTYQIDPNFTGATLDNNVQITADDGDDIDSDPLTDYIVDEDGDGNGLDDDEFVTTITVDQSSDNFDLALTKILTTAGPHLPGDVISFELTVINQGDINATSTIVTDYNPSELIYQSSTSNSNVIDNGDGTFEILNLASPQSGSGTSMETVEVFYQIDPATTVTSLINDAEITADSGDDIDSTPGNNATPNDTTNNNDTTDTNGGDDQDAELVTVIQSQPVFDLALTKVLTSAGPYVPGDIVSFELTVINQGNVDATSTIVTDYNPSELIYQNSTSNANVIDNGDGTFEILNLASPQSGSGTSMQTVEVFYQIDPATTAISLINDAEITADSGDDVDSTPANNATPNDTAGDNDIADTNGGDDQDPAEFLITQGQNQLASIGNFVWEDIDGNGIQDNGEPGVEGIQVILRNANDVIVATRFTDAGGMYLFEDIEPGAYYVEFNLPFEYSVSFPNMDNNNTSDSDVDNSNGSNTTPLTTLSAGENDLSWDAGIYICIPIGDTAWLDLNENNINDQVENGVNGLRVNLFRQMTNGQYILWDYTHTGHNTETTSEDGYFKFCSPPGTYYLEFVDPPTGLVVAQPGVGAEDVDSDVTGSNGPGTTDSFTVLSGGEKCDLSAGYYAMGTLGDFVFIDANQNGLRDPNESGLGNVYIQAFNHEGQLMGEATTSPDGSYMMDYLQQTDVYLKFYPPGGYTATLPHMGPENMDSDIDNANGPMTTQYYDIQSGEHMPHVDAGLIFGVVPVSWTAFEGEHRQSHNWLEWELAMEFDVSHYEVERSFDSVSEFKSVRKVISLGNTSSAVNYNFEDYDIAEVGTYYYRIKQVDLNGSHSYSSTIALDTKGNGFVPGTARIYPNPSVGEFSLDVEIFEQDQNISYLIYSNNGKLAVPQTLLAKNADFGKHQFLVDENQLTPGVYTIQLNIGTTALKKKLIIIQ